MNSLLASAAALAFLVGLAHSVIGEILIFRRLRQGGLVPTNGGSLLKERHVRILWASWHVLTVFGWCIAAALLWLSLPSSSASSTWFIEQAVVVAMLVGSALVFFGTKARHPGWAGLLAVAVLVWLGRVA
jgi:drug/metabolite transporter (DMT)-like permease